MLAAPMFSAFDSFTSMIYIHNTSDREVYVDLTATTNSQATPRDPYPLFVSAGAVVTLDVQNLIVPNDPDSGHLIAGGIRLRHEGDLPEDVRAQIVVSSNLGKGSFTVPFRPALAAAGAPYKYLAPVMGVGPENESLISVYNFGSYDAVVYPVIHLETGQPGGPTDDVAVGPIVVPASGAFLGNFKPLVDAYPAAQWASVELQTDSSNLVFHALTVCVADQYAFDSEVLQPAACVSTTKVVSPLVLNYNAATITHVLIRNVSAESRTLTATVQKPEGPSTHEITIAAGHQKMFDVEAVDHLDPGEELVTNLTLTYTGDPADVIASGVSLAPALHLAVPARMTEPAAADGRRLTSPYFSLEGKETAILVLTNTAGLPVKAGAILRFADGSAEPVTSPIVTVASNEAATIDLRELLGEAPDGVAARGAVELVHSGTVGSIAATVFCKGISSTDVQSVTMRPIDMTPECFTVLSFPNHVTLTPGGEVQVAYVTDGSVSAFTAEAIDGGTVTQPQNVAPRVYQSTYTAPSEFKSEARIALYDSAQKELLLCAGTTVTPTLLELDERKPLVRLNPLGGTQVTLTAKGQSQFPAGVEMYVTFKRGNESVTTPIPVSVPAPSQTITFPAPANTLFVGDVDSVRVEDSGGNRITKAKKIPFYYAYDPPDETMTPTPNTMNRAGGFVEIVGTGFRTFENELPRVKIGEITFNVREVRDGGTKIIGTLGRALYNIDICPTSSPCRRIKVTNPGGKDRDQVETPYPVFTLNSGPFPFPNGFKSGYPNSSTTRGGDTTVIVGTDMWNLRAITFGGLSVVYDRLRITDDEVTLTVPYSCTAGVVDVVLADIDNRIPDGQRRVSGGFRYTVTPVEPDGFALDGLEVVAIAKLVGLPVSAVYRSGPRSCGIALTASPDAITVGDCGIVHITVIEVQNDPSGSLYLVTVYLDSSSCPKTKDGHGTFSFTLTSSEGQSRQIEMSWRIIPAP